MHGDCVGAVDGAIVEAAGGGVVGTACGADVLARGGAVDGAAVGIPTVAADIAAAYTGDILNKVAVGADAATDTVYVIATVYDSVWEGGTKSAGAVSNFQLTGVKAATSADLTWTCATGAGPTALLPIDTKYLPASCR